MNNQDVINIFKDHELYFVGGYVRDTIMNAKGTNYISNDIDFATNVLPQDMIDIAKTHGMKIWFTDNSVSHGTVNIGGCEITTFRKDVSCDGRNATIEFAKSIEEDLSRRDFTINAIAINAFNGEIIDPFNGISDIENHIIRCVGNPFDRLREDTLRALRAVRFVNKFNFDMDIELENAVNHTDISNISVERIREEFMKIFETGNFRYINLIIHKVIPEFKILDGLNGGTKHGENVDVHSILTMKNVMMCNSNALNSFIALFHDIGKAYTTQEERLFKGHEDVGAEKIKEIMQRMKFSNDEIEYAYYMIKNHMRWHFHRTNKISERSIKRAINSLPEHIKYNMIRDLCVLTWADNQANTKNKRYSLKEYTEKKGIYEKAFKIMLEERKVIGNGIEFNGNDLIDIGLKPSPIFTIILDDIKEKVIDGKLENKKELIMKYVKSKYKKGI